MMDEQDLPIDIHYNKLLDWLIDRRHCDPKWVSQIRPIREKINTGLLQLPTDEERLASLRDKRPLNYFHCQQMLDALKSIDGDTKSLFGKFTSARVQTWAEIVSAYKTRSMYLAECAQQLACNVNYEIPALKQSLSRSQQVQRDSEKKEQESRTNAAVLRAKFISSCKEMGVEGVRVREELQQLLSELPVIFKDLVSTLPTLAPAIHFYQSFVQHSTGRSVQLPQFLPMLSYIMQNGNVTVYQWKHGTVPEPTKNHELLSITEHVEDMEQIDWGDLQPFQTTDLATGQVNGSLATGNGAKPIEWDDVGTFDVSEILVVEESLEREARGEGGGEAEGEAGHEAVASAVPLSTSAEERDSLLSNSSTRSLFIDDVIQLKEFLSRRVHELSSETGVLQSHFTSECEEGLQLHGLDSVMAMLVSVTSVLDSLTNSRTQHLLLMKGSARYLERMATSLLSPQLLSNRLTAQAEAMAARRKEAVKTALSQQPKLAALINDTKELQKQVEECISLLYKNRDVNIIGEINVM